MTQKIITFFGDSKDQYHMPEPFYRYLIVEVEAPWLGINHYIASILPLTDPCPMPAQRQFLSGHGMNQALNLAVEALKGHLRAQQLRIHES